MQAPARRYLFGKKEAEEIAGIADNLLLPEGTGEFVAAHRAHEGMDDAGSSAEDRRDTGARSS